MPKSQNQPAETRAKNGAGSRSRPDDSFTFPGGKRAGEMPEPTASELDQISKLLAGEDDQDDDQDDQRAETRADDQGGAPGDESQDDESEARAETRKSGKPKNLEDAAKRLGLEVTDLYALEIPLSDVNDEKRAVKLGELKDAFDKRDRLEVDQLAWEETKAEKEREFLRSAQELQELVGMLPKAAISKELIHAVQAKRQALVTREEKRTLDAIPSWKDDDAQARDREAMAGHLSQYGFPANYLDSLVDHRTLVYVRENMQRQQRIEKALEQVRTVRKPGHSPSTRPSRSSRQPQQKTRRTDSQVSQVAKLLNLTD
jgi:hypothetical protein